MYSVNLVEVDSSNWTKEVIKAEKLVVVEFYTPHVLTAQDSLPSSSDYHPNTFCGTVAHISVA